MEYNKDSFKERLTGKSWSLDAFMAKQQTDGIQVFESTSYPNPLTGAPSEFFKCGSLVGKISSKLLSTEMVDNNGRLVDKFKYQVSEMINPNKVDAEGKPALCYLLHRNGGEAKVVFKATPINNVANMIGADEGDF